MAFAVGIISNRGGSTFCRTQVQHPISLRIMAEDFAIAAKHEQLSDDLLSRASRVGQARGQPA
ncbi:MAG: hypothetical protein BWY17_01778 [Deltaproteobacteria bacterium ADurb.Bin207]|nr:MAG: hypothetical protein BWY17_01778 [Deltaproteobacteria bacterium ADurb.Bin207]